MPMLTIPLLNRLFSLRRNPQSTPQSNPQSKRSVTLRSLILGSLASLLCVLSLNTAMANSSTPAAVEADAQAAAVNINLADAPTIAERLVGIGLRRAEAIVEYRDTHGKFQDPYELVAVKGVGEATVQKNASRIRLHD